MYQDKVSIGYHSVTGLYSVTCTCVHEHVLIGVE